MFVFRCCEDVLALSNLIWMKVKENDPELNRCDFWSSPIHCHQTL